MKKKQNKQPGEANKPLYTTDKTLNEYLSNPSDTRSKGIKTLWYRILKG